MQNAKCKMQNRRCGARAEEIRIMGPIGLMGQMGISILAYPISLIGRIGLIGLILTPIYTEVSFSIPMRVVGVG